MQKATATQLTGRELFKLTHQDEEQVVLTKSGRHTICAPQTAQQLVWNEPIVAIEMHECPGMAVVHNRLVFVIETWHNYSLLMVPVEKMYILAPDVQIWRYDTQLVSSSRNGSSRPNLEGRSTRPRIQP